MVNNPLVSIIIPVFNAEKYLRQSISSAINQTWKNIEIILVDDGSTDNSLRICRSYPYGFLKVLTQKNAGASSARNLGLSRSKGDYIQFLDADDHLSPNKVSAQLSILRNFPDHLALCGTVYFNDDNETFGETPLHPGYSAGSDDPADFLIKLYGGHLIERGFGGMIQPNSWLTPRKIIDKAGLWNAKITLDDDGEFFCRVILASKGIRYSNEAINYYRKHSRLKSLSGEKSLQGYESMFEANKLKLKYLFAQTKSPEAKLAMSRVFWENCYTFYPDHKGLASEASKTAKSLDSSFKYNPYQGIKYHLAELIGWKGVKILQKIKHVILIKTGLRKRAL